MTAFNPDGIEINGVAYTFVDRPDAEDRLPFLWRPYKETIEPLVVQQSETHGNSRPGKSGRPDILNWKTEGWEQGEGQKFIDQGEDASFKRYWYSNAIDVRTPGQVSLGYKLTDDVSGIGTTTQGPYLAVVNGYLTAIASDTQNVAQRAVRKNLSTGVWSSLSVAGIPTANSTRIAGGTRTRGNQVYAPYLSSPVGTGDIRVFDPSANSNAQFINRSAIECVIANGVVYHNEQNNFNLELHSSNNLTAGSAGDNLIGTVYGIILTGGMDALGKRIFWTTQGNNEEPHLYYYPDTSVSPQALAERVKCPVGFRQYTAPFEGVHFLGDILWINGYREGNGTGFPECPMILYVAAGKSGTLGVIRDGVSPANVRGTCLAPGFLNQLLIGTDQGDPAVYVYDVQNGGLSRLLDGVAAGSAVFSISFTNGQYYVVGRPASNPTTATQPVIYATQIPNGSNNNTYVSSSTIRSSYYDFGYPDIWKLVTQLEVVTDALPAGSSVSFSLVLDDGTSITTDSKGNALTHSGTGATRAIFDVSGLDNSNASVVRKCKVLRVDMTLNAGTNAATTPTVRSWTVRAKASSFVHWIEGTINLFDDTPGMTQLPYPQFGKQKADNLRTLRDTDPSPPVSVKIRYRSGNMDNKPDDEVNVLTCVLESCEIILFNRGNGAAYIKLRRIDKDGT